MSYIVGRYGAVKVGASYDDVSNITNWEISVEQETWESVAALEKWKTYTLLGASWCGCATGYWDLNNTGHNKIFDNLFGNFAYSTASDDTGTKRLPKNIANIAALPAKFYIDGTGGTRNGVAYNVWFMSGSIFVKGIRNVVPADRIVEFDFDFVGTGELGIYRDGVALTWSHSHEP